MDYETTKFITKNILSFGTRLGAGFLTGYAFHKLAYSDKEDDHAGLIGCIGAGTVITGIGDIFQSAIGSGLQEAIQDDIGSITGWSLGLYLGDNMARYSLRKEIEKTFDMEED